MKTKIKILLSMLLGMLVFGLDIITPLGIAGGVPYVVFVMTGFWFKDKKVILGFGALSALLTVVGYHVSPNGGEHWKILLNRTYAILAIGTITFLAYYSKSLKTDSTGDANEQHSSDKLELESRTSLISISFVIGVVIVAIGLLSINLTERTFKNSQEMYLHPLVVSNAARDIRIDIFTLQNLSKKAIEAENEASRAPILAAIHEHSLGINNHFALVNDPFLGNEEATNFALQAFQDWEMLKNEILALVATGQLEAATQLNQTKGAIQLAFLDGELQKIADLASTKAKLLNQNAIEDNNNIKILISILVGVVLLLGIMAVFVLDTSRAKRQKAQAELAKINLFLEDRIQERTSDLLSALEHAQQVNAMKSRFVSMASHEFRTPLAAILSSVSLISKYSKGDQQEKRERHAKRIKTSVKNLTEILSDFLSMDKLEQGKIIPQKETFNLKKFCTEVVAEVALSKKEGQKISHVHDGQDFVTDLDKKMLRNILSNLLSNATKYSPQGYPIQLYTKHQNGSVIIQVKDQGIGIPEQDKQYLFEQFYRASNVTGVHGTGLGLNIVKYLSEMMGGRLSYDSIEDKGSTFWVEFPQKK